MHPHGAGVEISPMRVRRSGRGWRSSVDVRIAGREHEWWFDSTTTSPPVTADAFLAGALRPAMKVGGALTIHAPVSDAFVRQTSAIQRVFEVWRTDPYQPVYPTFRRVKVRAENRVVPQVGSETGLFFSAGVDSFEALLRLRAEVNTLVYIDDFERRFDPALRAAVHANVEEVAHHFGKALVRADSNSQELFVPYVSRQRLGSFVTTHAILHAPDLGVVHLPSNYDISALSPWGSHPMLDELYSAGGQRLVYGSVDVTRLEKVASIARSDFALSHLRVCWGHELNCGRCSKCVRTMLALLALDRLDAAVTFPRGTLTPGVVRDSMRRSPNSSSYFTEIGAWLEDHDRYPEYVDAIAQGLSREPKQPTRVEALGALAPASARRAFRRLRHPGSESGGGA